METDHSVEMLDKLERMGNLESVVAEQRMRIEKLKTTYETLKVEHLQLQDVSKTLLHNIFYKIALHVMSNNYFIIYCHL